MNIRKPGSLVLACILVIFMASAAGCTSSSQLESSSRQNQARPDLHVSPGQNEERWSFGLGCYAVASGTAYNAGTTPADNVVATVNLVDPNGVIRDSRSVAMGTLAAGASQSFTVTLDGECSHTYSLKYLIS